MKSSKDISLYLEFKNNNKEEKKHIKDLINLISLEPINLSIIKNYVNKGFKYQPFRPTIWKLLLNYLPPNKFKIEYFLIKRRNLYKTFLSTNYQIKQEKSIIEDINRTFLFPKKSIEYSESNLFCDFLDRKVGDRSFKKFKNEYFLEQPKLENGFKEKEILLKIQTSINLNSLIKYKKLSYFNNSFPLKTFKKNQSKFLIEFTYNETHREVINRLLQIHNQLNPAVGYIQGLHLLILPIYYVLNTSENIFDYIHSETDTFFLFINLIAEISECLVKNNPNGLIDRCIFIPELIKVLDFDYFIYLKFHNIFETKIYLKWIICLFGTEYKLFELIDLWDYFLSDSNRYELVYFSTISILLYFKEKIQRLNSEDILIFLQSNMSQLPVLKLIELSKKNKIKYYELKKN